MLLFHNFLFLTLQLIHTEHKYAVTTQSRAHKVKYTHHSNTKHRERLRNMGLRVHYLHPCFSTKWLIYLIIQIISSLNFPSFSANAVVMKKNNFTGMIELCLHVCVCDVRVRVWCSTSSANSIIMGEKGMSHTTPLTRQVKRVSYSISFNIFISIF